MERVYILHYSLGFSPYRTGGLTKFVMDLMQYQYSIGVKVGLLWPGRFAHGKTRIKNGMHKTFFSREIINPLPVSLCNGIQDERPYLEPSSVTFFENFLIKERPSIIHVHTLEGLHAEFLIAAKKLNIKLIYTTHDFFGICPTNYLYKNGALCGVGCVDCSKCNTNAYSISKIKIMQSFLYRKLKNTAILRLLRKKNRKDSFIINESNINYSCDYQKLSNYYLKCFGYFDMIHCNSSVTYNVFKKIISPSKLFICNLTHLGITDSRFKKAYTPKSKVRFCFLGGETVSKGFFFLIDILDEIYKDRNDFSLVIYSKDDSVQRDYIEKHPAYTYKQLSDIYANVDILLVPSICYETFSYIVLESFSFGVPSLVTDSVGAKDIIANGKTGFIASKHEYKARIISILENKEILVEIAKNIKESSFDFSMEKMNSIIYGDLL